MNKKAIVIGASSGIGRSLARVLSQQGFDVGLACRRVELLRELQREIRTRCWIKSLDLNQTEKAMEILRGLIDEMGEVDLVVINSGINIPNPDLEWSVECETMRVNALGFMAMANVAVKQFLKQGGGHLVGISSMAALRGGGKVPAYNASKACMSNYLAGLAQRLALKNIFVTDIRPGFVDTPMIREMRGVFWAVPPDRAARQIFDAIRRKKKVAYVTKRWAVLAWFFKRIPDWLYDWGYRRFRG